METDTIVKTLVPSFIVKIFAYIMYIYDPPEKWIWSLLIKYSVYIFFSLILFFIICRKMMPRIATTVLFYYGIMCMINMFEYVICIALMEAHLILHFTNSTSSNAIKQSELPLQLLFPIFLMFFICEVIIFFIFLYKYYLFTESEKGLSYD